MPQVINTNVSSLTAQRNLNTSQGALSQALTRLSSGLRINSAKDDAAGLAISERFTSQVRGLNQAIRNANDGISLLQTAEGALGETSSNLQRIRELALQAANATNSPADRKALQAEVNALQAEITRVADTTTFNNTKVLDGNFSQQQFQVGANQSETIGVTIRGARATQLANNTVVAANTTTALGTGAAANSAGSLATVTHPVVAQTLTFTTIDGQQTLSVAEDASIAEVAAQVNAVNGPTGISATASTSTEITFSGAAGNISFTLGSSGDATTTIATSVSSSSDLSNFSDAINDASGTTGITASLNTAGDTVTLSDANGDDIEIESYTATIALGDMLVLGSTDGSPATLSSGFSDSTIVTGELTLNSADAFSVQSDVGVLGSSLLATGAGIDTASTANSVASIDISTVSGANAALAIVDSALETVSSTRGDLGALQNRFETTISNLQTVSENASAARSRIVDADFAAETAALTRAQILQQAGISILAQANAQPQNVLSLLS